MKHLSIFEDFEYEDDIDNVLNDLRDKGYQCEFHNNEMHYHIAIQNLPDDNDELLEDIKEAVERLKSLTGRYFYISFLYTPEKVTSRTVGIPRSKSFRDDELPDEIDVNVYTVMMRIFESED